MTPSSYDEFAAVYERWSAHMTEDVAWYTELVRQADGPVVELAVGTGRVAIPAARATGKRILGIDVSEAMLAEARTAVAESGADVELRQGDMRELDLDEPAALIYCPFRSLLHLPTWADRRRVFERVAASLRPGGRFAWNAFVFNPHIAARNDGVHEVQNGIGHVVHHHPHDNRLDIVLDGGGATSLWWITRSEWEGLIEVAGLEVESLHGWFDGTPFGEDAPEFVWVARRPS